MATKIYAHDRVLDRMFLWFLPRQIRPNQITVLRIIMTPVVAWLIYQQRYELGIPLFVLVAFTDALDGSLARTRGMVTTWGMLWDPIADKSLIGSVAAILLLRHFPLTIAVPVFALEAAFIAGGLLRKTQGRIVAANRWGKLKMLMQVIGVALFLCALAFAAPMLAWISYAIFGLAIVFALISLFSQGL